jgi:hypothetical protein
MPQAWMASSLQSICGKSSVLLTLVSTREGEGVVHWAVDRDSGSLCAGDGMVWTVGVPT